jgi:hypothetical protein
MAAPIAASKNPAAIDIRTENAGRNATIHARTRSISDGKKIVDPLSVNGYS